MKNKKRTRKNNNKDTKLRYLDRGLLYGPYYALCLSEKEFIKEMDRHNVDKEEQPEFILNGSHASTHFFTNEENGMICLVCMDPIHLEKRLTDIMGLLVHEASHIYDETMLFIRETNPGKEVKAFAHQNIAQNLYEAYISMTKKKRKKK